MIGEIVQVDDDGRLFLSGAVEDWKPVHARRITIVIDLEGDVDHGVPTAADESLYIYLPIHDGGYRTSNACTPWRSSARDSWRRGIECSVTAAWASTVPHW